MENRLLDNPESLCLNDWHARLIKQREKLMLFNKKPWGNFAWKKWLVDGDRNSRLFHQTVVTKNIAALHFVGSWIDDETTIQQ